MCFFPESMENYGFLSEKHSPNVSSFLSLKSCPILTHWRITRVLHFQNLLCFHFFQFPIPLSLFRSFCFSLNDGNGFLTDLLGSVFCLLRFIILSAAGLIFLNHFPDSTPLSAQRYTVSYLPLPKASSLKQGIHNALLKEILTQVNFTHHLWDIFVPLDNSPHCNKPILSCHWDCSYSVLSS